MIGKSISKS